jgi:molybdopterin synthase sulfur carrier subunit
MVMVLGMTESPPPSAEPNEATVELRLRAPLSELCGGNTHRVPGETVGAALRSLEAQHPAIAGWILDEQGHIREHVNVFVNRALAQEGDPLTADDRVQVLPSITGG